MAKESKKNKNLTNIFLKCGVVAGPLYIFVGIVEMFLNPGFDIRRHSLSLLSAGHLGWIHVMLFMITGFFVFLGAIGIRMAIKGEKAGTWAPILLGVYGLGLMAAGYYVPDPMKGFPPGETYGTISTGGIMHLVAGMVGFIGLIVACFVFARRFMSLRQPDMAMFSWITGIVFFVSFFGIAAMSQQADHIVMIVNLAFTFAVVLSWMWLSTIFSRLIK
jgi:hypothetical protein